MADVERLRGELYAAFKNRALMYWHIFDELRRALGEPQATGLLGAQATGRIEGTITDSVHAAPLANANVLAVRIEPEPSVSSVTVPK